MKNNTFVLRSFFRGMPIFEITSLGHFFKKNVQNQSCFINNFGSIMVAFFSGVVLMGG